MKFSVILVAIATVVSAAAVQTGAGASPAPPADMHNSRISLDWAGTYEGVLPCDGCPGTKTRLTLNQDGSYRLATQEQGSQNAERFVSGTFLWQHSGNAITLDERGNQKQFSVGEGRLTLLLAEGASQPPAANLVLMLAQSAPQGGDGDPKTQIGRYLWTLVTATDANGHPIVGLPPGQSRPVVFTFSGTRLSIQGPCNQVTGRFHIAADNQMIFTGGASTRMACRSVLMRADSALNDLLAKPLQVKMTTRPGAQLSLVSPNGSLTFKGDPTRESIYGAPTTIFLEIAPHSVECANPIPPATRCVQYRERHYDEEFLPVGPPEEWRPMTIEIEGFTHREGIRNVLRVYRYQGPASADGKQSVHYVLDMVVESEHVVR